MVYAQAAEIHLGAGRVDCGHTPHQTRLAASAQVSYTRMAKITVLTATFREWDFLLKQRDALEDQTFQEFEWVIVDDLLATGQRAFTVQAGFAVLHVPPSHYSI